MPAIELQVRVRPLWPLRPFLWCLRRLVRSNAISLEECLECGAYVTAYLARVEFRTRGGRWRAAPWHLRPRPESIVRRVYEEMFS